MTIGPNQPDNHSLKLNLPFSASNKTISACSHLIKQIYNE